MKKMLGGMEPQLNTHPDKPQSSVQIADIVWHHKNLKMLINSRNAEYMLCQCYVKSRFTNSRTCCQDKALILTPGCLSVG